LTLLRVRLSKMTAIKREDTGIRGWKKEGSYQVYAGAGEGADLRDPSLQ